MTDRPSGWYDDPDSADQLRYWDGILWSDRTMSKVKPGLDQSHISDPYRQWEDKQKRLQDEIATRSCYHQSQGNPCAGGHSQGGYQQRVPGSSSPLMQNDVRQVATTLNGEKLSSWWCRIFAFFIDYVLMVALTTATAWHWFGPWAHIITTWYNNTVTAAQTQQSQPPMPQAVYHVPWQYPLIMLALYAVYEIGMVVWRGQTLGKMLTGIRVRSVGTAAPPKFIDAGFRFVVKDIYLIGALLPYVSSLGSLVQLIDGLLPLGDQCKQSLHDKAAKTYVVCTRSLPSDHWPSGPGLNNGHLPPFND